MCIEGMCDTESTYLPIDTPTTPVVVPAPVVVAPVMTVDVVPTVPATGIAYGTLGSACLANSQCPTTMTCMSNKCQNYWLQPAWGTTGTTYFTAGWNILKYAYGQTNQGLVTDPISGTDQVLRVL